MLQSHTTYNLTKIWSYHYTSSTFTWVDLYIDQWGGINSQCTAPGSDCGKFDWKARYIELHPLPTGGFEDPCPGNNNPAYGHGLVVAEVGSDAPPYLPTFSLFWH